MKNTLAYIILLVLVSNTYAMSPWLQNLDAKDKQAQIDLRWKAYGGEADLKFMHKKLQDMNITIFPQPQHPEKHWDYNHLVYKVDSSSSLELQIPYGNIENVSSGKLIIQSDFSLSYKNNTINVTSFYLVPDEKPLNKSDIVTFKLVDQNSNHLFTIDSVHIEYDQEKKLLLMSNMDMFASHTLAKLLHYPELEGQVVGQLKTYSHLQIPVGAMKQVQGSSCAGHPLWPPNANTPPPYGQADVALIDIGNIQWMRDIGADKIVIAPSARLKNVGTADIPWYQQFTSPQNPYNNDQHPFLNWAIYREIDNRFEQVAYSGVKHAFLTINSNCTINCGDNHILWLGCEDVYGTGNNDSSFALGPRAEIEADTGFWDNCGSFFDPDCIGSHTQSSNTTDENRLVAYNNDLTDINNTQLYMQAWYLIRDDINIFNSMGYRSISPVYNGSIWDMNPGATFTQGAALDNYVAPGTSGPMQDTSTVETGEGQITVAVKVIDLGNGSYRYNYAIENYEFDPRFISYQMPLSTILSLTDPVFSDPDHDLLNDWQFNHSNGNLSITGNNDNEQDWGMLFSFSFTTNSPPISGQINLIAASTPVLPGNTIVEAGTLIPMSLSDLIFKNGFNKPPSDG